MAKSPWAGWARRAFGFGVLICFLAVTGTTCTPVDMPPAGNENGNANDNSGTSGSKIVNIESDFALSSLSEPISVIYTVVGEPDLVSGIYVRLNADGTGGAATLVMGAEDIPAGTNQQFRFDPELVAVGAYQLGIAIQTGTEAEQVLSEGIVVIQGPPDPKFIQPTAPVTEVAPGSTVTISFDAGDPENDVQWRLFYLSESDATNVTPDQLGTQLATGTGNVGQSTFTTTGLDPGDYQLGVSATDSGFSVATTVQRGELDRIVTIPGGGEIAPIVRIVEQNLPQPPTVTITAPGSTDETLFLNEEFTVVFEAIIREPDAEGLVDVFYDLDTTFNNGYTPIGRDLPASRTMIAFPTDLSEGTYHVGASVSDGINPVVFTYAAGTIMVVRTATLSVTAPNSDLPIPTSPAIGTPNSVAVMWTTNVPPADTRTVDVFARTLDQDGIPVGAEIPVLAPTGLETTSASFSSQNSGIYEISVRIRFTDGAAPTLVVKSPKPVRVSGLPRILWLGSLVESEPIFEGAVFEGVNFEDNAGTAFSTAGDLNGDGLSEFVVNARYGKPFFVNPSGLGQGEAYIVYGRSGSNKLTGSFNLNSVGLTGLRGITLTGIPTVGSSDDTDGLSAVTQIPDADDDGLGELVFGFPRTNSAGGRYGDLEANGQFLNGGVVILSSNNALLGEPDSGTAVIDLGAVGQRFSSTAVNPPVEPTVADQLTFDPGDPNANPPRAAGCIAGTDGVPDTVIGPGVGFLSLLAPPAYEQAGLEFIPATATPAPGRCPTQFELAAGCAENGQVILDNSETGSGFYAATGQVRDPIGARIIGKGAGDAFGTSVTSSIPVGTQGPGDLIITAPRRTAEPSEIDGLGTTFSGSGVAYLADNEERWPSAANSLPRPFQFVVGGGSDCGDAQGTGAVSIEIAGDAGDAIQNVLGIRDFNRDGRNDIAVGAPTAGSGKGRVYIAYRRESTIEGDVILKKLELAPTNPERLTGILITSQTNDGLGSSMATGVDFNGDGASDLVIGSPNASTGVGEVIVLFGDPNLVSGENGLTIQEILTNRTSSGAPRAARIKGNPSDPTGLFGFNVANAGDVDGDGKADLMIAAPNASPRFDSNPSDATDVLNEPGLDLDFDGDQDDVTGPMGAPDGTVDGRDDLLQAGIVYVISSRNRLDRIPGPDVTVNITALGGNLLRGFMVVGRRAGDRIGGGDAGDVNAGGIGGKAGRGRSFGLASAGDVDGDRRADLLIGSILADPRVDPNTGIGVQNGGEAYLVYGTAAP